MRALHLRISASRARRRLKRKRQIQARLKCHKNKDSCKVFHSSKFKEKPTQITKVVEVKQSNSWKDWFKKISIVLKSMIASFFKGKKKE